MARNLRKVNKQSILQTSQNPLADNLARGLLSKFEEDQWVHIVKDISLSDRGRFKGWIGGCR